MKNIRTIFNKILCTLLLGTTSLAGTAYAAETVSGDITMSIAEIIQISDLDDISVSPFTANTTVPALWYLWEPYCTYSNAGTQFEYTIRGDGGSFGPTDSFRVSNGSHDIPYRGFFFSTIDGVTEVFPNATQTFSGASNVPGCNGANTSWFAPAFLRTDLEAAPPFGIYIGRFIITVAPI